MVKLMEILGLIAGALFFGWILWRHLAEGGRDAFVSILCGGMTVLFIVLTVKSIINKDNDESN